MWCSHISPKWKPEDDAVLRDFDSMHRSRKAKIATGTGIKRCQRWQPFALPATTGGEERCGSRAHSGVGWLRAAMARLVDRVNIYNDKKFSGAKRCRREREARGTQLAENPHAGREPVLQCRSAPN